MRRTIYYLSFTTLIYLFFCSPLFSSGGDYIWKNKLELGTSFSLNWPLLDSSYRHSFSPPFQPGPYTSSASQALKFKANRRWGANGYVSYFPFDAIGLQLMVDYFEPSLAGENSPYEVNLQYTASPPPDTTPLQLTYQKSHEWPDTEGHLEFTTVSLNGIFRFWPAKNITVSLSGGWSYFQIQGEAGRLAFTKFWLGGHSVLFIEDYQLQFGLKPASTSGLNFGIEGDFRLYHNLSLTADVRYFYGNDVKLEIDIREVEGGTEPLAQIKARMNLEELKITPSFFRMNLGLKYRF